MSFGTLTPRGAKEVPSAPSSDFANVKKPLFYGLKICLSGFTTQDADVCTRLIVKHGGVASRAFTEDTSILLLHMEDSLVSALQWLARPPINPAMSGAGVAQSNASALTENREKAAASSELLAVNSTSQSAWVSEATANAAVIQAAIGARASNLKYQEAIRRGIPIVRPQWLAYCIREGRVLFPEVLPTADDTNNNRERRSVRDASRNPPHPPPQVFEGPLFGHKVCTTGLSPSLTALVAHRVVMLGGLYSARLDESVSLLLVDGLTKKTEAVAEGSKLTHEVCTFTLTETPKTQYARDVGKKKRGDGFAWVYQSIHRGVGEGGGVVPPIDKDKTAGPIPILAYQAVTEVLQLPSERLAALFERRNTNNNTITNKHADTSKKGQPQYIGDAPWTAKQVISAYNVEYLTRRHGAANNEVKGGGANENLVDTTDHPRAQKQEGNAPSLQNPLFSMTASGESAMSTPAPSVATSRTQRGFAPPPPLMPLGGLASGQLPLLPSRPETDQTVAGIPFNPTAATGSANKVPSPTLSSNSPLQIKSARATSPLGGSPLTRSFPQPSPVGVSPTMGLGVGPAGGYFAPTPSSRSLAALAPLSVGAGVPSVTNSNTIISAVTTRDSASATAADLSSVVPIHSISDSKAEPKFEEEDDEPEVAGPVGSGNVPGFATTTSSGPRVCLDCTGVRVWFIGFAPAEEVRVRAKCLSLGITRLPILSSFLCSHVIVGTRVTAADDARLKQWVESEGFPTNCVVSAQWIDVVAAGVPCYMYLTGGQVRVGGDDDGERRPLYSTITEMDRIGVCKYEFMRRRVEVGAGTGTRRSTSLSVSSGSTRSVLGMLSRHDTEEAESDAAMLLLYKAAAGERRTEQHRDTEEERHTAIDGNRLLTADNDNAEQLFLVAEEKDEPVPFGVSVGAELASPLSAPEEEQMRIFESMTKRDVLSLQRAGTISRAASTTPNATPRKAKSSFATPCGTPAALGSKRPRTQTNTPHGTPTPKGALGTPKPISASGTPTPRKKTLRDTVTGATPRKTTSSSASAPPSNAITITHMQTNPNSFSSVNGKTERNYGFGAAKSGAGIKSTSSSAASKALPIVSAQQSSTIAESSLTMTNTVSPQQDLDSAARQLLVKYIRNLPTRVAFVEWSTEVTVPAVGGNGGLKWSNNISAVLRSVPCRVFEPAPCLVRGLQDSLPRSNSVSANIHVAIINLYGIVDDSFSKPHRAAVKSLLRVGGLQDVGIVRLSEVSVEAVQEAIYEWREDEENARVFKEGMQFQDKTVSDIIVTLHIIMPNYDEAEGGPFVHSADALGGRKAKGALQNERVSHVSEVQNCFPRIDPHSLMTDEEEEKEGRRNAKGRGRGGGGKGAVEHLSVSFTSIEWLCWALAVGRMSAIETADRKKSMHEFYRPLSFDIFTCGGREQSTLLQLLRHNVSRLSGTLRGRAFYTMIVFPKPIQRLPMPPTPTSFPRSSSPAPPTTSLSSAVPSLRCALSMIIGRYGGVLVEDGCEVHVFTDYNVCNLSTAERERVDASREDDDTPKGSSTTAAAAHYEVSRCDPFDPYIATDVLVVDLSDSLLPSSSDTDTDTERRRRPPEGWVSVVPSLAEALRNARVAAVSPSKPLHMTRSNKTFEIVDLDWLLERTIGSLPSKGHHVTALQPKIPSARAPPSKISPFPAFAPPPPLVPMSGDGKARGGLLKSHLPVPAENDSSRSRFLVPSPPSAAGLAHSREIADSLPTRVGCENEIERTVYGEAVSPLCTDDNRGDDNDNPSPHHQDQDQPHHRLGIGLSDEELSARLDASLVHSGHKSSRRSTKGNIDESHAALQPSSPPPNALGDASIACTGFAANASVCREDVHASHRIVRIYIVSTLPDADEARSLIQRLCAVHNQGIDKFHMRKDIEDEEADRGGPQAAVGQRSRKLLRARGDDVFYELANDVFDADMVVTNELSWRESVIMALCGGCWLMKPSYVEACKRAGTIVGIEHDEEGGQDNEKSDGHGVIAGGDSGGTSRSSHSREERAPRACCSEYEWSPDDSAVAARTALAMRGSGRSSRGVDGEITSSEAIAKERDKFLEIVTCYRHWRNVRLQAEKNKRVVDDVGGKGRPPWVATPPSFVHVMGGTPNLSMPPSLPFAGVTAVVLSVSSVKKDNGHAVSLFLKKGDAVVLTSIDVPELLSSSSAAASSTSTDGGGSPLLGVRPVRPEVVLAEAIGRALAAVGGNGGQRVRPASRSIFILCTAECLSMYTPLLEDAIYLMRERAAVSPTAGGGCADGTSLQSETASCTFNLVVYNVNYIMFVLKRRLQKVKVLMEGPALPIQPELTDNTV